MIPLTHRPRRSRIMPAIRDTFQETRLHPSHLIAPIFLIDGEKAIQPIESMPGVNRLSVDLAAQEVIELYQLGIRSCALFPVILESKKDPLGQEALNSNNLMALALKEIKSVCPEMCLIVDIALDPYTSHGHDGVVDARGFVQNDETVEILAEMALHLAASGADIVAPSDMMDGRVGAIRNTLDINGFIHVSIMSYAAKYASSLYAPFREALHSKLQFGDKRSYQMNPANIREALLECALDERQGADSLMIKPALSYLDVVAKVKEKTHLPVGAYHVSGEYAMVMAAHERGWLDAERVFYEHLLSIKRAGADFIFSYAAKRVVQKHLSKC